MLIWILLLCCSIYVVKNEDEGQEVAYLHVNSQIHSRFAVTVFSSQIQNLDNKPKEIFFHTVIPEEAFITNFSMLIKDNTIYGSIQEKQKAKETYDKAVQKGQSAGLVAEKPRETNSFQISVNIGAKEFVTFNLTYQEILKRVHGVYKHVINVETAQPVKDMKIKVVINEMGKITNVKVPIFGPKIGEKTNLELLNSTDEPKAKGELTHFENSSQAVVTFDGSSETNKTAGQLVLLYDVERDNTGGSVQVLDGYFVHFFAPSGLTKSKKHIIFVLDQSGSMAGRRFLQLQEAMKRIIKELDDDDKFNILFFDDRIRIWKPESVQATKEVKDEAVRHVLATEVFGSTNIFDALKKALEMMKVESSESYSPTILFLTDGEPTVGVQSSDVIVENITAINQALDRPSTLHSLAFGRGADYKLVQRLSKHNRGLAKKIYEDADADLQLTGFYAEISTHLLSDIKFEYLNGSVDVSSLAHLGEYNYYDGGELVVIGKLATGDNETTTATTTVTPAEDPIIINPFFDVQVTALGAVPRSSNSGLSQRGFKKLVFYTRPRRCCYRGGCGWWPRPPYPIRPTKAPVDDPLAGSTTLHGFIERMWAYLTVKKLLKDHDLEPKGAETKKAEALKLSLKYKFVTPLTSMVVVQPDSNTTNDLSESQVKPAASSYHGAHYAQSGSAMGWRSGTGNRKSQYLRFGGHRNPSYSYVQLIPTPPPTAALSKLPFHPKPLLVYVDIFSDTDDEVTKQHIEFMESINKHSKVVRGKQIFIALRCLQISDANTITVSDSIFCFNAISALDDFKSRQLIEFSHASSIQPILDNLKLDGQHVTLILTKDRSQLPKLAQLNTAFENFVIDEMKNQTFLFAACFNCTVNLDGYRSAPDHFRFLKDSNSFAEVVDALFK